MEKEYKTKAEAIMARGPSELKGILEAYTVTKHLYANENGDVESYDSLQIRGRIQHPREFEHQGIAIDFRIDAKNSDVEEEKIEEPGVGVLSSYDEEHTGVLNITILTKITIINDFIQRLLSTDNNLQIPREFFAVVIGLQSKEWKSDPMTPICVKEFHLKHTGYDKQES